MEWLIKLSKPVDLIGILQITPGLFQVLLAGALSIGGGRERLFLSIFKGRQGLRQPRLGGGGRRQPVGSRPCALFALIPAPSLPSFSAASRLLVVVLLDHCPQPIPGRSFFTDTFGEPTVEQRGGFDSSRCCPGTREGCSRALPVLPCCNY